MCNNGMNWTFTLKKRSIAAGSKIRQCQPDFALPCRTARTHNVRPRAFTFLLIFLLFFIPLTNSYGEHVYTIQIGAYGKQETAEGFINKLGGSGIDCRMKQSKRLFKVSCGRFSSKEQAVPLKNKLAAIGHKDAYISFMSSDSQKSGSLLDKRNHVARDERKPVSGKNLTETLPGPVPEVRGKNTRADAGKSGDQDKVLKAGPGPLNSHEPEVRHSEQSRATPPEKKHNISETESLSLIKKLWPENGFSTMNIILTLCAVAIFVASVLFIVVIFLRKKGTLQDLQVRRLIKRNKDIIDAIAEGDYSSFSLDDITKKLLKIRNTQFIEFIVDRAAALAGKAGTNIQEIYDATGITDRYIESLKNSNSWKKRAFATEKLGLIGSAKAVPYLIEIIRDTNDEDEDVRSVALRALGRIQDRRAIPFLVEALGSPETWLPPRIGEILVNIGNDSVEYLKKELTNFDSESRRGWSAEILGWLNSQEAVQALIESLFDVSPEVRAKTAGALGKIKSDRSIIKLTELLISEPIPFVRTRISQALGAIGHPSVIHYLVNILKDPEWWVRVRAVEALEQLGEMSIPSLLVAMEDHDSEVRRRAALALERIGYVEKILDEYSEEKYKSELRKILFLVAQAGVVESLCEKLESSEGNIKKRIVRLLGEAGTREASEPLINLLRTEREWTLKARIIQSLGKIGAKEAVPLLIENLKDSQYWVRRSAVEALATLEASEYSGRIAAILDDPHPYAREAALSALAMLKVSSHWDKIEKLLYDPAPKVRTTAVRVMRELGIIVDRQKMLNVLTEASEGLRIEAIRYFAAIVDAEVLPDIIRLLALCTVDLRREIVEYMRRVNTLDFNSILSLLDTQNLGTDAVGALIEIASIVKDDDAYNYIIDFTGSVDETLREEAYRAASVFGFDEHESLFEKALFDPSRSVRTIVLACVGPNSNDAFLEKAKVLGNDPDENVRLALILAFGASGLSQFRPLILKMLDDPSLKVVAGAFIALACFHDPLFLKSFYSHNNLKKIKKEIINITGDLRLTHVIEEIKARAKKLNNLEVSLLFAGNDNMFANELVKKLREALDPVIRMNVIEMLKIIATPDLFTSILNVMKKDPYGEVRIQAMDVVASIGREEEAITAFSSSLMDPAPDVRSRAAELLGEYKNPRALEALLHVLDTPDREFREVVTNSLSHLLSGEQGKVAELVKSVPETKTRKIGMAWLMGKSRKRGSLKFLVNILGDKDPDVRAAALGALGKFKKKQSIGNIEKLVYDPNERVRAAAVNAVAAIGGERAYEIVRSAIQDIDSYVRTRAVIGLAKIDLKSTISILQKKVKSFPEFRPHLSGLQYAAGESYENYNKMDSLAVNIVSELCDKQDMLSIFNRSSDGERRMHAFKILAVTSRGSDQKFLSNATKDPLPEIRDEAIKLLRTV